MAKFSGNVAAAENYIIDSLKSAQDYYMDDASLGSTLTIDQIGEIVYEDAEFKIDDVLSNILRNTTVQKIENAHMIVYFIGNYKKIWNESSLNVLNINYMESASCFFKLNYILLNNQSFGVRILQHILFYLRTRH